MTFARLGWPSTCAFALTLAGCTGDEPEGVTFTPEERAKLEALTPAPEAVPDTTNKYADDPAAAAFGQRLFFDPGYSGPIVVGDDGMNGGLGAAGESGKVSCRSCHLGEWLIDDRSRPANTSLGIDWFFRNAPTLVNVATYEKWFGWVGFNDTLWGKSLIPAEFVMGTTRSGIVHYLFAAHRAEYEAVFGEALPPELDPSHPEAGRFPSDATPLAADGSWSTMTAADQDAINRAYANFGKALAAYQRLLVTGPAPFDRFMAGDDAAISEAAKRGARLFIGKAACVACHAGPTFSDEEFHVTGVPQVGEHVLKGPDFDPGRLGAVPVYLSWDFSTAGKYNDDPSIDRSVGVTADPALAGAFRTKGLRNVAMTGPYMHTGHMTTLREVVEFYNAGGADADFAGTKDPLMKPLNLSEREIDDLVAFLEALTGTAVPAELLVDPAGG